MKKGQVNQILVVNLSIDGKVYPHNDMAKWIVKVAKTVGMPGWLIAECKSQGFEFQVRQLKAKV